MTPFACLLAASGLSLREAAEWLRVTDGTVRHWQKGRRQPPDGVLAELRQLVESQAKAADEWAEEIDAALHDNPASAITIGCPADDAEAKSLGFPAVSAWAVAVGQVIAAFDEIDIELVPRGSTAETAAAADRRDTLSK